MAKVYLCLGSNIEDRLNYLKNALKKISELESTKLIDTSSVYETEPWGVKEQNDFLNIVIETETDLSPSDLLNQCQNIEKELGRNREKEIRWGERTIDIDILFYGNSIINTQNLIIPHPRIQDRRFVLIPMNEINPEFIHPVFKNSIENLLSKISNTEKVNLFMDKSSLFLN